MIRVPPRVVLRIIVKEVDDEQDTTLPGPPATAPRPACGLWLPGGMPPARLPVQPQGAPCRRRGRILIVGAIVPKRMRPMPSLLHLLPAWSARSALHCDQAPAGRCRPLHSVLCLRRLEFVRMRAHLDSRRSFVLGLTLKTGTVGRGVSGYVPSVVHEGQIGAVPSSGKKVALTTF